MSVMNICRSAYALIFLLTVITVANAQGPNIGMSVTRSANADIFDGNIASARKKSLQSALRGAIENIMGSMVGSKYQEKHARLIERYIFSNSLKYILRYEVIEESTIHDQSYAVRVKAVVDYNKLEQDLDRIGILQNRLSSPDIVLIIIERLPDTKLMNRVRLSENVIRMELKKAGFFIVDSDMRLGNALRNEIRDTYAINIREAIAIGNELGGDILVYGISEVTLKEETDGKKGKMNNIEVSIDLKAVKLDNGIVLSESSALAVYPHSNLLTATERAIGKASARVVKKLEDDIVSRWKTEVNAGRQVILSISNVTNISQFHTGKNLLKNYLTGPVEVESRSFNGIMAEYNVVASTTGYKMASELEGKKFNGLNIKILHSSLHALSVALVSQ